MEEQSQQQAFTFATPTPTPISSSEQYAEDALHFDYQSWIKQSNKITSNYAEAINKNHHEILLLQDLPEEDYELSLRDLCEVVTTPAAGNSSVMTPNNSKKPCRKKTPSMERVCLTIKLSMSRPAAATPGRKKSFSSSTFWKWWFCAKCNFCSRKWT